MSFEFVVTVKGVLQMRGNLTQATAFLVERFGSLEEGMDSGARILPEWLTFPPKRSVSPFPTTSLHAPSWHQGRPRI